MPNMENVIEFCPKTKKWATSNTHLGLNDAIGFSEWCAIGTELASLEKGVQWWIGDWWAFGKHKYGTRAKAAAQGIFGRSFGGLANCGSVARRFETSRRREVLHFNHHAEVVAIPREEADELLDEAESQRWSIRELRAEVSRRRVSVGEQPSSETCTISDLNSLIERGIKFGTIYADPPWKYDNQGTRAATSNHYQGMTVEELCELPIRDIALPDSHLHLWTTNGFLFECSRIFESWGFVFKSSFVWVKPNIGIGNYWRNSHEFLLTAVRGNAKSFRDKALRSWIECKRGEHSAKPEQVRHMIEKASNSPFLELFGRMEVPGWTVWGNQIRADIFNSSFKLDYAAAI